MEILKVYALKAKQWVLDRAQERTTLDGVVLVVAGVSYLLLKPIAVLVAYLAIGYGAWTIYTEEKQAKEVRLIRDLINYKSAERARSTYRKGVGDRK